MKYFFTFRPHPYIFFNQDRVSITFVGFMVQMYDQFGDLIDPNTDQVLEKSIISEQLYESLKHNMVDFQDDCRLWTKPIMIEKLATVMGVEYPYDPEPTYVLTVDNVIKILAIQMRFRSVLVHHLMFQQIILVCVCRCGIPVVIMGETGCGKTRLIRYMCDLLRQGKDTTNMLILKVISFVACIFIKNFLHRFMVVQLKLLLLTSSIRHSKYLQEIEIWDWILLYFLMKLILRSLWD